MPGWIDERDGVRSLAGSAYNYDRRVPMILFGGGLEGCEVDSEVDMTDLAASTAHILGIDAPAASGGRILSEVRR